MFSSSPKKTSLKEQIAVRNLREVYTRDTLLSEEGAVLTINSPAELKQFSTDMEALGFEADRKFGVHHPTHEHMVGKRDFGIQDARGELDEDRTFTTVLSRVNAGGDVEFPVQVEISGAIVARAMGVDGPAQSRAGQSHVEMVRGGGAGARTT